MSALLRFEAVRLRRGGRLLFENLDLDLGTGDALQVTGPNGSGKSSLIRLAAGLLQAERGRIQRAKSACARLHPERYGAGDYGAKPRFPRRSD